MILCLGFTHGSIFQDNASRLFLIKSAREPLSVSFVTFYQQTFLATFYLFLLDLSLQILPFQIHSFKPLLYICDCKNSTKVEIFLIL